MGPKTGAEACFRVLPGITQYSGWIVGDKGDNITLDICDDSVPHLSIGHDIVITGNLYVRVVDRESNTLTLDRLWDEKRQSFRVYDRFFGIY